MTAMDRQELWARLRAADLVEGEPPAVAASRSPWFVRVMLGMAGWIGAMFLLGFVGVGFVMVIESATASFLLGAAVCAGAAFLFRAAPENDFMSQFGLAVSLAGGYVPRRGDDYELISYRSRSGRFDTLVAPAGFDLVADYDWKSADFKLVRD